MLYSVYWGQIFAQVKCCSCCDLLMSTGVLWVWHCIVQDSGYWCLIFVSCFVQLHHAVLCGDVYGDGRDLWCFLAVLHPGQKHTLQWNSQCLLLFGLNPQYFHITVCKPFLGTSLVWVGELGFRHHPCNPSYCRLSFALTHAHSFQTLSCRWASSTQSHVLKMLYHRLREEAGAVLRLGALKFRRKTAFVCDVACDIGCFRIAVCRNNITCMCESRLSFF